MKLPPKHSILRNLAVNEAPHGFVSTCESCRLPPKISKHPNLAVNHERSLHRELAKIWNYRQNRRFSENWR